MPDLANPHDRFFKQTFGQPELAADFLQHYLPASVAALLDPDPASLTLRRDSWVDEKLRAHMSDLVFEARLRDESAALIYVLFEHKSRPERLGAFQLLRYLMRLWENDLRTGRPLLPVLPVVVYHGLRRWQVAQNFGALFVGPAALRPYWPEFRYDLTDLSRHGEAEIRGAVATQVWVELMRHIFSPRWGAELPRFLRLLQDLTDRSRPPSRQPRNQREVTQCRHWLRRGYGRVGSKVLSWGTSADFARACSPASSWVWTSSSALTVWH